MTQTPPPPPQQIPPPPPPEAMKSLANQYNRAELRAIASQQKFIMGCITVQLILHFGSIVVRQDAEMVNWEYPIVFTILAASVAAAVFAFILSIKLFGTATGVLLGILTLIPCIGLLSLLVINSKATQTLKDHGIRVSLLGAKLSSI